jgi:flagellin
MSLNSVNTNVAAIVALQSFDQTESALQAVQKQVSTGYRVADATDDGAAYAVAQRVRSDVGALTAANQQLGNVTGLLTTTVNSLNSASTEMISMRDVLVALANGQVQGDQRSQYIAQYKTDLTQLKSFFEDSSYEGRSLIGDLGTAASGFASVSVIRNELGVSYHISAFGGSALLASVGLPTTTTSTGFTAFITEGGTFLKMLDEVGTQLNYYGSASDYVTNQVSFNSDKIDALNTGLGSLVDADLAKESAQLQALQIRQQLGEQALSIANQAPSALLTLFK